MSHEKKVEVKCVCACGYKHYNTVACKIKTMDFTLTPAVLNGTEDIIVDIFILTDTNSNAGEQGQITNFSSQFSAIEITQKKVHIIDQLNDNDGNFNTASPIMWTRISQDETVERYRLHVNALPSKIIKTIDAHLFVQFWRSGSNGDRTANQSLSSYCPQIVIVNENV